VSRGSIYGNDNSAANSIQTFAKYDLELYKFTNDSNDLDAFISRFELVAQAYRLPSNFRDAEFAKCLTGPALQSYETMSNEEKLNYRQLIFPFPHFQSVYAFSPFHARSASLSLLSSPIICLAYSLASAKLPPSFKTLKLKLAYGSPFYTITITPKLAIETILLKRGLTIRTPKIWIITYHNR
jgi:hypothetical protein